MNFKIYRYWGVFSLLIVMIGIISGVAAIFFRDLIGLFHNILFYGKFSINYDFFKHAQRSPWGIAVIFVPVIGGIIVTFLIRHLAPEAKGDGVPEVIDAIHFKRGEMRPPVSVIKALTSAICIGSGGSVGREGPVIQIGAAIGSGLAKWFKLEHSEKITLIAAGASAALAATFNTPIGGVFFAVEVMLLELRATTVVPITIATVVGTYVCSAYSGGEHFLPATLLEMASSETHLEGLLSCIPLGIVVGATSALFIWSVYLAEDTFNKIPRNHYTRHIIGMFIVGLSMYFMMENFGAYYIQGVGYSTVYEIFVENILSLEFLMFLAFFKIFNTAMTLGSGGSGGIFSPSLFIGATIGGGMEKLIGSQSDMSPQFFALAGMAGMVGASTGAVITSVVMVAEMANDLIIIMPTMLVVAVAYMVRWMFVKDSIYTLHLTRAGRTLPRSQLTLAGQLPAASDR